MLILGFNAYHGDVSAAILRDGQLVAVVEEERFRRIKHCAGFPRQAIDACLKAAGAQASDVDVFAVPRARGAHLVQKALFALTHRPGKSLFRAHTAAAERREALALTLARAVGLSHDHVDQRLSFVEHHPAHLASAFFASPFEHAAVCAVDGFGDFVSTSVAEGHGTRLDVLDRVFFPHSLGLLYTGVTQHLGFKKYGDEFKVMGLAPYGVPTLAPAVHKMLHLESGGGFTLDLRYFRHWTGEVSMTWDDGEPVLGDVLSEEASELLGPPRRAGEPLTAHHEALAASIQAVFEDAYFHVLGELHHRLQNPRLCLAGGCAMNSVANGKVRTRTPFREVYVQPGAGDNGTALGAALYAWHQSGGRRGFQMRHGYWGTSYDADAIRRTLDAAGPAIDARCRRREMTSTAALCAHTARHLAAGRIVGWFQGRMEWGARALGNRSILADPRRADMRDIINTKIKFRERFRPFAPSVLEEAIDEYFVGAVPDPFMIQVYPVRPDKRAVIPAVTHVDGSGRLQTVSDRTNPLYAQLIAAFRDVTGVPVLLNTSFNENEPIVERPEDALDCFLRTDMDVLVMGPHVLEKLSVPAEPPQCGCRAGGPGETNTPAA